MPQPPLVTRRVEAAEIKRIKNIINRLRIGFKFSLENGLVSTGRLQVILHLILFLLNGDFNPATAISHSAGNLDAVGFSDDGKGSDRDIVMNAGENIDYTSIG